MTRAPECDATRAARTPPEPAPITKRSTCCSAIGRHCLLAGRAGPRPAVWRLLCNPSFLQLFAHFSYNFVRKLICPFLREAQTGIGDLRLFIQQLFAGRRVVERNNRLQLLISESTCVEFGDLVVDFGKTRREICANLRGDFIKRRTDCGILLQEEKLRLFDYAGNKWAEQCRRARRSDQLLGGRHSSC